MMETVLCLALETARLRAGDLAQMVPSFGALPPGRVLAWAPAPGVRRWLGPAQLRQWLGPAASAGQTAVCIERAAAPLAREAVEAALAAALPEGSRAELAEWARQPFPAGRLEFAGRALPPPAPAAPRLPVLWRGHLVDADGRRYPFWARVRVTSEQRAVRVREAAPAGVALDTARLEEFDYNGPPLSDPPHTTVAAAAGCKPRRTLGAGALVTAANCRAAADIERGDAVDVRVSAGAAALSLTARAQTAGSRGATVWLENPATRRRFRARVSGARRAEAGQEISR